MDSKRTQHRSQDSKESFLDSIIKIGNEDSEGEDYIWYDTKEVYYPMYTTQNNNILPPYHYLESYRLYQYQGHNPLCHEYPLCYYYSCPFPLPIFYKSL